MSDLFNQTEVSPGVITADKIEAHLAEVRQFEADYWPFMQAYGAVLMGSIEGRRAWRAANTDIASGRRAMSEDPYQWSQ